MPHSLNDKIGPSTPTFTYFLTNRYRHFRLCPNLHEIVNRSQLLTEARLTDVLGDNESIPPRESVLHPNALTGIKKMLKSPRHSPKVPSEPHRNTLLPLGPPVPTDELTRCLDRSGYAVVHDAGDSRDALIELSRLAGDVQRHERADEDGIVQIESSPSTAGEVEQFAGQGTDAFPLHTDGSYLDEIVQVGDGVFLRIGPPKGLLIQCVRPSYQRRGAYSL